MKKRTMFYYAVRRNVIDVMFWCLMLYFGIRHGVLDWYEGNGFLLVFFMCFYGIILVYRLGIRFKIQDQLITRCKENGIDVSDFTPH